MPNWSHNTVTITGPEPDVAAVVERLGRPYTRPYAERVGRDDAGEMVLLDPAPIVDQTVSGAFLLWNITAPDPSIMDEYVDQAGQANRHDDEADENLNDWHHWNVRNWGTKWETGGSVLSERSDGKAVFTFDTAWSMPWPALESLSAQVPSIHIRAASSNEGCYSTWGDVIQGCVENYVRTEWDLDAFHDSEATAFYVNTSDQPGVVTVSF